MLLLKSNTHICKCIKYLVLHYVYVVLEDSLTDICKLIICEQERSSPNVLLYFSTILILPHIYKSNCEIFTFSKVMQVHLNNLAKLS